MLLSKIEKKTVNNNLSLQGIDEVGRGPLAGPLFVASYKINNKTIIHKEVNDSKKLSEKKREYLYQFLTEDPSLYKVYSLSNKKIDDVGIVECINILIEKCALNNASDKTLIDGIFKKKFNIPSYNTVIKGDSTHYSIAAASIIAKVTRDRYMTSLKDTFPQYEFEKNKGYGTKVHIDAIKKFGITKLHRKTFLKNIYSTISYDS